MEYKFYGNENVRVKPSSDKYAAVEGIRHLYDMLSGIWCPETCAPRMREKWTEENMTLGQCSITAFLAQDIFGGDVYGIKLEDGGFHCYNVVGDDVFDLTSEQFGDILLKYDDPDKNVQQFREVHFADEDKKSRYEMLKARLDALLFRIDD